MALSRARHARMWRGESAARPLCPGPLLIAEIIASFGFTLFGRLFFSNAPGTTSNLTRTIWLLVRMHRRKPLVSASGCLPVHQKDTMESRLPAPSTMKKKILKAYAQLKWARAKSALVRGGGGDMLSSWASNSPRTTLAKITPWSELELDEAFFPDIPSSFWLCCQPDWEDSVCSPAVILNDPKQDQGRVILWNQNPQRRPLSQRQTTSGNIIERSFFKLCKQLLKDLQRVCC